MNTCRAARARGGTAGGRAAASGLDVEIHSPKMSWSRGRLELCAADSANKRVFIFGGTTKGYGERLEIDGRAVKDYIEQTPGVTKGAALKFKAQLRQKP